MKLVAAVAAVLSDEGVEFNVLTYADGDSGLGAVALVPNEYPDGLRPMGVVLGAVGATRSANGVPFSTPSA